MTKPSCPLREASHQPLVHLPTSTVVPLGIRVSTSLLVPGDFRKLVSVEIAIGLAVAPTADSRVKTAADADFIVQGRVKATALPGGQEQIEIHWIVNDNAGHEAGDVAQGHDFPQGALDRFWGDVAEAVAEEAAGGVHEVITNWSGRKAAKAPGNTKK